MIRRLSEDYPTSASSPSTSFLFLSLTTALFPSIEMLRQLRTLQKHAGQRTYATSGFLPTKYGGKYTATLIPGDGIGQEVATSVKEIFAATNVPVEFEEVDATGILATEGPDGSEALYRKAVESIRRNKVGLKGILYTPLERSGHASFNVALRQELDLYASTVFIKNFPGLVTRHAGIDAVIIRENTEGEYSGLEQQAVPGVVEALKVITRAKSERIARFALDFAQRNGRKKITVIHKANIMKLADGLFRDVFYETAADYPDIKANDMIVDNASMQAVSKPQQFDVMLMPNLYGSILSNVMGGLVGGPGLIPGCNIGREYALFEPGCRHVGLDIKGKDQANPLAMVLSSCMMLRHLGLDSFANAIAKAAYGVIEEGKVRTRDMKGQNSTHDMTKAILDKIVL